MILVKILGFAKKHLGIIIAVSALVIFTVVVIVFRSSLIPGWYTENGQKYYLKAPFSRASGICHIGGRDYAFYDYGVHGLRSGWMNINGVRYYADEDGVIVKGEQEIDGKMYNFDLNTGAIHINEMLIEDGRLWYYGDDGYKRFGIVDFGDRKYYFNETGNLRSGFVEVDGKIYYFDTNEGYDKESMVFGFQMIDGYTYYFGDDGAAYIGTHIIDGIEYTFDDSGALVE